MNATGWMLYDLTYLLLYPKYNCEIIQPDGTFSPIKEGSHQYEAYCKPEYFCQHLDQIKYTRDEASDLTLNNFISKYNAECFSKFDISLPGMMFFTGWALCCTCLPRLGDVYGRKFQYMLTLLTNLIATLVILLLPGPQKVYYYIICAMYLLNGMQTAGRCSSGYVYMTELAPERYRSTMGTIWNMCEGLTFIYLTIYFKFISKNWEWTFVFGASL